MPLFHFHLRVPCRLEWDAVGVPFDSLEEAFIDVCDALPTMAGELLQEGHDLGRCTYLVAAPSGETLLEVSFGELQRAGIARGTCGPSGSPTAVREHLARAREVAANAQSMSVKARATLVRCRAVAQELRQRRDERDRATAR